MKNLIICFIALVLIAPHLIAQNAPQGMKYQAVARDLSGDILAEQNIVIQIKLQSDEYATKVHYTEVHSTITNQFGLFSLIIGEGNIESGIFDEIPWSTEEIWMSIYIKDQNTNNFTEISNSKLFAVPYAYYAEQAGEINSETLIIMEDGQLFTQENVGLTIRGDLEVQGDNVTMNNDLYVGRDVFLNYSTEFNPKGETINYGNFTVMDDSETLLTGTLNVVGETNLESNLIVNNESSTTLTGALNVNLNALFNKNVSVADTLFADVVKTKSFNISKDAQDGEFIATFENTNNGDGDGIKIKLGKQATKNNSAADAIDTQLKSFVDNGFDTEKYEQIKSLLDGDLNPEDLAYLALLQVPTADDLLAIGATVCQLTETIGNELFSFLNNTLSLPATVGPYSLYLGWPFKKTFTIVPRITVIPEIPEFNLPCEALGEGFQLPHLEFSEYINDPLNNENNFIVFTDNTNWKMGSIRAESVEDWAIQYLDPVFLFNLYATFKGMDKAKILPEMKVKGLEIATSYLEIGVQYSSGNGDYAEWLERLNPKEAITAGDIVAVKGGKITKDLTNAEQIMAVSHRPIVLGNAPKKGKEHLGNNISFMGQIPVKIMGPVKTGDYIVAKSDFLGYGIAISPENMSAEDFKLAVGRSWDVNNTTGPKMVNTVIGVRNGDYLDILKQYEAKFKESQDRLQSLESKVEILVKQMSKKIM